MDGRPNGRQLELDRDLAQLLDTTRTHGAAVTHKGRLRFHFNAFSLTKMLEDPLSWLFRKSALPCTAEDY